MRNHFDLWLSMSFSKSDEKNSRCDGTFKVGTTVDGGDPKDKIYIVEPYVHHVFITQMSEVRLFQTYHTRDSAQR
jgi:hypothetical protein